MKEKTDKSLHYIKSFLNDHKDKDGKYDKIATIFIIFACVQAASVILGKLTSDDEP